MSEQRFEKGGNRWRKLSKELVSLYAKEHLSDDGEAVLAKCPKSSASYLFCLRPIQPLIPQVEYAQLQNFGVFWPARFDSQQIG